MGLLKNKVIKNASWIIACRVVKSVLALVITMLTARYFGPSNFGLINYAASIVAFASPIMLLGLSDILVQELKDNPSDIGVAIGTSMVMTFCSAIICMLGVSAFAYVANAGESETFLVCVLYSFMLLTESQSLTEYWFQSEYKSKYVSIISLISYFLVSAYKFYLLATSKSIYWFAISNAFDFLIISILQLIVFKKISGIKLGFSFKKAKILLAKSRYYIISNLMVTIFAQTDRIMLKLMIDNSATGYYSAAFQCAGMTSFVFSAIITSFRPKIFEDKKLGVEQFEKNVVRLYSVVIFLSLVQCVFITVFSKWILLIVCGSQYLEATNTLRIVVWYTTFAYLGSVRNIWILAEEKQKYLWIINLSGAVANIILNFALIPYLGIIGAAIASLITQIFTNVIVGYIIKPIRHNNRLMVMALNPQVILREFRKGKI